ncbi:hypothetical protein LXL04_007366 [Taraxacum kok-saghyz]
MSAQSNTNSPVLLHRANSLKIPSVCFIIWLEHFCYTPWMEQMKMTDVEVCLPCSGALFLRLLPPIGRELRYYTFIPKQSGKKRGSDIDFDE